MYRPGAACFIVVGALSFLLSRAHASVVISSYATQNMACSGGVCSPTASNAVLNAGDLEALLAAGSITVTTNGADAQLKHL
ncbi:MAG TPA: hypothetical protein VGF97_09455 [Rhizomicrobium sp.]|jgi:hypothetical protein